MENGFNEWVFGGEKRILMLKSYLKKLEKMAYSMIVLTNGIADDVHKILNELDLLAYFYIIADTRGKMIVESDKIGINNKYRLINSRCSINGLYNKENFINNFLKNPYKCVWEKNSIIDNMHIIYLDDNPEMASNSFVSTIPLQFEGDGIDEEILKTIIQDVDLIKKNGKNVTIVWDFDCTLTHKHMFKSMRQPHSKWAIEWQNIQDDKRKNY